MSEADRATFRKSRRSEGGSGCVEAATVGRRHLVRDSKNPDGDVLALDNVTWRTFIDQIKSGDHDL